MPVARSEPADARVIAHVDLDCFYVQVEQRRRPELKGKPTAVIMYNPWKGGGIIAVGYEARAAGVTRKMRGDDARKVCPDINLIQVPTHFGKADLADYREAGSEVVAVFSRGGVCERASIDEVYLDVTEAAVARLKQSPPDAVKNLSPQALGTHIVGLDEGSNFKNPAIYYQLDYPLFEAADHDEKMEVKDWLCRSALFASRSDQLLACGAMIIAELRTTVHEETGFTTSAGIAHNKMLAKLASGMHKPAQQTLIPSSGAPGFVASLPVKKLKGLGGKLGKTLERDLGLKLVGDLLPYSESKLQDLYGTNTGTWLWRVARGMNGGEVEGRVLPKSHGCGKTFRGAQALKDLDSVSHWLSELAGELQERLEADLQQNNRSAKLLVCHAACHLDKKGDNSGKPFPSKSCAIRYGQEKIAHDALVLFKRSLSEFWPNGHSSSPAKGERASSGCRWVVTALTLSANNMLDASGTTPITQFFSAPTSTTHTAAAAAGAARDLVKVTTPPSSPSSLRSLSSVSPLDVEDSSQLGRFGKASSQRDNTCAADLEATTSMGMESGTPWSSSVEGLDQGGILPFDSCLNDITGYNYSTGQPINHTYCDASNGDSTLASSSANGIVDTGNSNKDQTKLSTLDDSRLGQSFIDAERVSNRPANGATCAEDSKTDPRCTSKFGVPGISTRRLTVLDIPEDSSGSSIQPTLERKLEPSLPNSSHRNSGTLSEADIIACSPLEVGNVQDRGRDSIYGIGLTEEGSRESSELWSTSSDQVCRSLRWVAEQSPGRASVPEEGISEHGLPSSSSAMEGYPKAVTLSNSEPRSVEKSKVDNVIPGDGSVGSSKRLVFQRVDELWGKSRPTLESSSNTKKSTSSSSSWNYKEDEIDEGVLSELPEEIQHELRNQLRLKRPKTTRGRSTISDFFKTNSSTPK